MFLYLQYIETQVCPSGKVWNTCADCEKTCDNMHITCPTASCRKEGCTCPKGQILSPQGKCITADECPCHYQGKSYKDGEVIKRDCNHCYCSNSSWVCTTKNCPGFCQAYGDPHYITFDGKAYEFQGACSYVLAEDFCGGAGTFRITVENVPCGAEGLSCTKSAKVLLYDTVIHFVRGTAPIISKNPLAGPNTPKAKYEFKEAGVFLIMTTPHGLTVQWDKGMRIYVTLAPSFMSKVCGLCGNYDGKAENDFRARSGQLEDKALIFANSWRIKESCPNVKKDASNPCDKSPERELWAKHACNILRTPTFQKCHAAVEVERYYKDCVWDSCGCARGGDCECLCTAVAAYVKACNEKNIHIKWRSENHCRKYF